MFLLVPDGPYRKSGQKLKTFAFLKIFKNKNLKSAAIGYFGHMWELYAFWAFVPVILKTYQSNQQALDFNIPLLSFLVIAVGALGCIIGGNMSNKFGDKRLSIIALSLSLLCCLVSPFILEIESWNLFLAFLLFWGMVVIADSPLLSTLVARNSASELKGTALTIVNSIGFFVTIISIQLLTYLNEMTHSNTIYLVLAIGPIIGIMALVRKVKTAY